MAFGVGKMIDEPDSLEGTRIVIDHENVISIVNGKFKLPWKNRELKKMLNRYASVWCDYPIPIFDGDTEWLLFEEDK
jgi:hypothetical protein